MLVLSVVSCGRVGFHPLDELSSAAQNAGGASGDTGTDGATSG